MKFSIVTVSYNQAEFLETAILSVLNQNADIEYIVVDPGSTDGSRDIISKYADRIDHVILEPDSGAADGLNKGFEVASGDVFGCLNSDDFYLPEGLSTAAEKITAQPCYSAWVGAGYIVDRAGEILQPCYSGRMTARSYSLQYAIAIHQSTFYARAAFRKVGGFNSKNRSSWDGELLYWMMRQGGEVYRHFEKIGCFRLYDQSLTGSGALSDALQKDYDRLRDEFFQHDDRITSRLMHRFNSKLARAAYDPSVYVRKVLDRALPKP